MAENKFTWYATKLTVMHPKEVGVRVKYTHQYLVDDLGITDENHAMRLKIGTVLAVKLAKRVTIALVRWTDGKMERIQCIKLRCCT